ncbi:GNAT family N-acetyltransferase [Corynebacterium auris]|uniref:GNAT family N-acetyltransferase n=1 Tax=Corynebacterium auris TaxID=44750 RepID=UPI0025B3017C|nr:GNAT family N-acetyltransferase [Corynebacterium auris]WJY67718.1 Putative phosphinothricin acetyltransferase YwnH [Corynebacterium auris]
MSQNGFTIRPIRRDDYSQVRAIYEMGLSSGHATYETEGPTWEEFTAKKIMEAVFVAVDDDNPDKILGWVSAAPASSRSVFHGVVEDSIYSHPDARGRGVSGALLDRLIEACIDLDKWSIHSWIFPENEGSAGLHTSRGFAKVGTFHHMAKMTYGDMEGEWRDTDIYELLLPKPGEKRR